jgi:predicted nucleic acid-binding protein
VILLDTNVVSELMRPHPEPAVVKWFDDQPAESAWTTSITVFEIRTGLELLEPGRRRRALEREFDAVLADDLEGRVQSFDKAAAHVAATVAAEQQRAGRSLEIRDVQIAGIVAARKATLATRNTRHFDGLGVALVDPWGADDDR